MAPSAGAYRPHVEKMTRTELEDSYYRIYDENQQLKRDALVQQEKLKKMAAKVLETMSGFSEHDIHVDEMTNKIAELEKQNNLLKSKLQSAKHQLTTGARPHPHHPHSGISPKGGRGSVTPSIRVTTQSPSPTVRPATTETTTTPSVHYPMTEKLVNELNEKLDSYEAEIARLRDELNSKESETTDEILRLKSQLTMDQRVAIQENVELIRLQRSLKEKKTEASQLQSKFNQVEKDLRTLKHQHETVLGEFDQVNTQLKTEQNRNAQLSSQLHSQQAAVGASDSQIHHELENLKRENDVLKLANEKLMTNTYNLNREREFAEQERVLKGRLVELENAVKADVTMRNELLEKLASELALREKVEDELRKLEVQLLQLKAENERTERKLKTLTGGGVSWTELEQAVAVIRQKKDLKILAETTMEQNIFAITQEKGDEKDEMERLRLSFADTVAELEKTRNMLIVQHKINSDYQAEVSTSARKLEEYKREYELQLKNYADLLDQRALRIQRLEAQLRDIAYGRRGLKTDPASLEKRHETDTLEPGQNLIELKLSKLDLGQDALQYMQSGTPSVFLTLEFYNFEIQFTPVLRGPHIEMDFTSEYAVVASDLFIHYLQTDSVGVELHQAVGTNYKTWAAGSIYLSDLLKSDQGRHFGSVDMVGVAPDAVGVTFARLDFTVLLKVPMEKALALYKERATALGYLASGMEALATTADQQTNQLMVGVHRCAGLKSKHPDVAKPSPYVTYQVFDFPDHDTAIRGSDGNPEFNDQQTWTIPIGPEADVYFRSQAIRFFVFDDAAPSTDLALLGFVDVPLLPLAHNKPVTGTFAIREDARSEDSVGTIDISVSWKFVYIPPANQLLNITKPIVDLAREEISSSLPSSSGKPDRIPASISVTAPPRRVLPPSAFGATSDDRNRENITAGDQVVVAEVHTPAVPPVTVTRPEVTPAKPMVAPRHTTVDATPTSVPSSNGYNESPQSSSIQLPPGSTKGEDLLSKGLVRRGSFTIETEEDDLPRPTVEVTTEEVRRGSSSSSENGATPPETTAEQEPPTSISAKKLAPLPSLKTAPPLSRPTEDVTSSSDNKDPFGISKEPEPPKGPLGTLPTLGAPTPAPRRPKVVEFKEGHESIVYENESSEEEEFGAATTSETETKVEEDSSSVKIHLGQLSVAAESPLNDISQHKVFVEWKFLDFPQEDCETPSLLPLPRSEQETVNFNFEQVYEMNEERIDSVREMVANLGRMEFGLVSDPGDEGECEELGTAHINIDELVLGTAARQPLEFRNDQGDLVASVEFSLEFNLNTVVV